MNLNDIIKNTLCEEMSYSSYDNYDSFKYENEIAFYNEDDESLFEMLENELNNKSEVIEMKNEISTSKNEMVNNNNEGSVNMNNNMNEMMMNMMNQMQALMEQNAKLQAQVNDLMSAKAPVATVAPQVAPVAPQGVVASQAPVAVVKPQVGTRESRVQADNHNATIDRSRFAETRTIADMSKVVYKNLNDEQKNNILSDIKDELFSALNPSLYLDVLAKYDSDILQAYYTRLLVVAGQYNPEVDNLDSLSKEELLDAIIELETDSYVERMLSRGKRVKASDKQLELLKNNGIDTTNIKYWWEASPILESIFGSNNAPTANQMKLIKDLVAKLELQGYSMNPANKKEASNMIEELQALCDEKFGATPATEAQKALYKRYLQMNNKRVTKKVEEFLASVSATEISKAIDELRKSYNEQHPECSEGQANYIANLMEQLFMPCNLEEVKKLTKGEATRKIDELSRQLLYNKMRRTMVSITMQEINKLTRDEVKAKLAEFRPQA